MAASFFVVPDFLATSEGNNSETASLGLATERIQVALDQSLLGLNVGDQITGLTFRLDRTQSELPAQVVNDYSITLSTSTSAAGTLSTTFADNIGADAVNVRSGPLTIDTGDWTGGGRPNPFGPLIAFQTPFVYQGGTLLVDYVHDGFPLGGRRVDFSFGITGAQTLFGNPDSPTANLQNARNGTPVFQFEAHPPTPEPEAVPEPAFVTGLLGVSAAALRKRRRRA